MQIKAASGGGNSWYLAVVNRVAHFLGKQLGGSLLWRVSSLAAFGNAEAVLWSEQESSKQTAAHGGHCSCFED